MLVVSLSLLVRAGLLAALLLRVGSLALRLGSVGSQAALRLLRMWSMRPCVSAGSPATVQAVVCSTRLRAAVLAVAPPAGLPARRVHASDVADYTR